VLSAEGVEGSLQVELVDGAKKTLESVVCFGTGRAEEKKDAGTTRGDEGVDYLVVELVDVTQKRAGAGEEGRIDGV
jgi:hypothetical protein